MTYRPALVHVGFGVGDSAAFYADLDWGWFNEQFRRTSTPHLAMHLEVSTKNWLGSTSLQYQAPAEAAAMGRQLTELCRLLRDNLAPPLVLENMDYMGVPLRPGYGVYRANVEPALM